MFEKLDDVPWADLEASCDRGDQIPKLLRSLVAAPPDDQKRFAATIEGVLTGQGELFEASPYAVPFLLEMLTTRHAAAEHVYPILWEVGNIRAQAPEPSSFRLPHWPPGEVTVKQACREAVRSGIDIYLRDAASAPLPCRRGAFELLAEFLVDDERVRELLPSLARDEPDEGLRRDALELVEEYTNSS